MYRPYSYQLGNNQLILPTGKYCFKHTSTFETGLSYHHHLIYLMLKTSFKKEEPKQFIHRNYKNFDNSNFNMGLESNLNNYSKKYANFEKNILKCLKCSCTKGN